MKFRLEFGGGYNFLVNSIKNFCYTLLKTEITGDKIQEVIRYAYEHVLYSYKLKICELIPLYGWVFLEIKVTCPIKFVEQFQAVNNTKNANYK